MSKEPALIQPAPRGPLLLVPPLKSRLIVTFWPGCWKTIACFRSAAEANRKSMSLTIPLVLIVPVPDNWLGDARTAWVVSVPPFALKLMRPFDWAVPRDRGCAGYGDARAVGDREGAAAAVANV